MVLNEKTNEHMKNGQKNNENETNITFSILCMKTIEKNERINSRTSKTKSNRSTGNDTYTHINLY